MKDGTVEDGLQSLPRKPEQLSFGLRDTRPGEGKEDALASVRVAKHPKSRKKRSSKELSERKTKDSTRLCYYAPSEVVVSEHGDVWLVAAHLQDSVMAYSVQRGQPRGGVKIVTDCSVRYLCRSFYYPHLIKGW